MKKVSIIIPIYNVKKYLEECLKSIENQTIGQKNIEVILINDGSTDGSIKIINKYKKLHSDWIVIDRENKGLSVSRNEGIELSTSEYIMFLDSDDYLTDNAIEEMYKIAIQENADVVIGRLNGFDSKGEYGYYSDKLINKERTFSFKKNKRILKSTSVCCKLYKKEIIENIRFIPKIKHEDNYFTLMIYSTANRITTIPKYYYYRRYREGERDSITQNLSIDSFKDLIKNYSFFFSNNKGSNYIIKFSLRVFNNYIISKLKKEDKKVAQDMIKTYLKELHCNKKLNFFEYIYYIIYTNLYFIFANLYYNVRRCIKK